jgi:hypothetical protein
MFNNDEIIGIGGVDAKCSLSIGILMIDTLYQGRGL